MPATVSFRAMSRALRFSFQALVKSGTATNKGLMKVDEGFCIVESNSGDVSYLQPSGSIHSPPVVNIQHLTTPPSSPGPNLLLRDSPLTSLELVLLSTTLQDLTTTPSLNLGAPSTACLLLRESPLCSLELALLRTAQCIAVEPDESQAVVLAVPATKATVIDRPIAAEPQVAIIDIEADAQFPSISVASPTLKKTTSEPSNSAAPLRPLQDFNGTLRPSGKKRGVRPQSEGDENFHATRRQSAKECTLRVYPSRPTLRRRDALNAMTLRHSLQHLRPKF